MEFSVITKPLPQIISLIWETFTDLHFIPIFKLALKDAVGNFVYYIMVPFQILLKLC